MFFPFPDNNVSLARIIVNLTNSFEFLASLFILLVSIPGFYYGLPLSQFAISQIDSTRMVIYVSNLGEKVTPDSLEVLFAAYGKVSSSTLFREGVAGNQKRFAYIEMMNATQAVLAISKLQGSIIDGCRLSVAETKKCLGQGRYVPAATY